MATKFDEVFSGYQPRQCLYETNVSRTISVLIQTCDVAYSPRKLHWTNHEASHPVFSVPLLLLFIGSKYGNVCFQKLPLLQLKLKCIISMYLILQKAILECETEWATNKKLVDLSGKDVCQAIPKGLFYFAVDFGLNSGFAHIIEDEKMFPRNFAQVCLK
jgi:hypothetical protein